MGIVRKTKSLEILSALFNQSPSAISVVDVIKKTSNKINKTTVYRALERMEEEGIIHSFIDSKGLLWYAKYQNQSTLKQDSLHPHFQCNDCGGIKCLSVDIKIPKIENFQIDSAQIMLTGRCKDCLN